ncbi:MAG: cytochrome P450 [Burkholderiaceae bacterium]
MQTTEQAAPQGAAPSLDTDPFSDDFLTMPYPHHAQMRDAGPVVWLQRYGVWAMARHTEVKAAFNDWSSFISSAGVGLANFRTEAPFRPKSLILEADPPDHTRARAVLARILSPKMMMQVKAEFTRQAEQLVDALVEKGEIDGTMELAERYPLRVFPDAVGLSDTGRENLLLYGDMVFNSFGPRNAIFQKAVERYEPVSKWIMDKCRREELRPGGFGDQIYQAADQGEITYEEAPLLVRSFLTAGVDTTVNGLGNALYCMATYPEQYARLLATPELARPAFEEVLRFESPVQTFFRTTSKPMEFAGVHLKENQKVLLFLASANRDERQWKHADVFNIERKPTGHMAFGSGIHGCVGQVVARLEGEVVLGALARRVKRIEFTGDPTRRLNNTLRAFSSLPLRLVPH